MGSRQRTNNALRNNDNMMIILKYYLMVFNKYLVGVRWLAFHVLTLLTYGNIEMNFRTEMFSCVTILKADVSFI